MASGRLEGQNNHDPLYCQAHCTGVETQGFTCHILFLKKFDVFTDKVKHLLHIA